MQEKENLKADFQEKLQVFLNTIKKDILTENNQWAIKGFIDVFEKIYGCLTILAELVFGGTPNAVFRKKPLPT